MHRIFTTAVADVYPAYVNKLERKGRTRDELDEVRIDLEMGLDRISIESVVQRLVAGEPAQQGVCRPDDAEATGCCSVEGRGGNAVLLNVGLGGVVALLVARRRRRR